MADWIVPVVVAVVYLVGLVWSAIGAAEVVRDEPLSSDGLNVMFIGTAAVCWPILLPFVLLWAVGKAGQAIANRKGG